MSKHEIRYNPASFQEVSRVQPTDGRFIDAGTVKSREQVVHKQIDADKWLRLTLVEQEPTWGERASNQPGRVIVTKAELCTGRTRDGWRSVQFHRGAFDLVSDEAAKTNEPPAHTPREVPAVIRRLGHIPGQKTGEK